MLYSIPFKTDLNDKEIKRDTVTVHHNVLTYFGNINWLSQPLMSQIKKFLFTIKSEGLLMFLWVIEWKISLTCNKYFECQLYA